MSTSNSESTGPRLRTKIAVASVALASVGVISALALTGPAQAGTDDRPVGTFGTIGPSPTLGTSPLISFITVGPTFGPPSPTFGTIGPPFTLITIFPPGSTAVTTTTTATTTTTSATTSPATTNPSGATSPPDTSPGGPSEQYTLDITGAQVNCDGTIHVEFNTTATPEPPNLADHLVVFNPTSNPLDFHVVETVGNAPNGAFLFEQLGSIEETYRVFVIALFEPTNLEGPKLVDQTDVLLAPDCA